MIHCKKGEGLNPMTQRCLAIRSREFQRLLQNGIFINTGTDEDPVISYDTRPEYVKFYDKTQDPFVYSNDPARTVDIQSACFTGGGAKGVLYAGVLKALEDSDVLANLTSIGGSSAGAITAVLLGTLAGLQEDLLRKQR